MVYYYYTLRYNFLVFLFLRYLSLFVLLYICGIKPSCPPVSQWIGKNLYNSKYLENKGSFFGVIGHQHAFYQGRLSPWLTMLNKSKNKMLLWEKKKKKGPCPQVLCVHSSLCPSPLSKMSHWLKVSIKWIPRSILVKPNGMICRSQLLFTQKSQLQNFRNFESPWHHASSLKMDHTRNIYSTEISNHLTPWLSSPSLVGHSTLIRTSLVICHCEKWLL